MDQDKGNCTIKTLENDFPDAQQIGSSINIRDPYALFYIDNSTAQYAGAVSLLFIINQLESDETFLF